MTAIMEVGRWRGYCFAHTPLDPELPMRSVLVAIAAFALLPACKSRVAGGRPQAAACVAGAVVPPGPGGEARTVTGTYGFVR